MTIRQLSIFLENQAGTLQKVLELIKQAHIQIIACTIADTAEYGIFRIICREPDRACRELKEAGVAVSLCEVFAVELDDRPGKAADAIEIFASEGINISYLYSFLLNGKGVLIFRTDNTEKAAEVIATNGLSVIEEKDLSRLL